MPTLKEVVESGRLRINVDAVSIPAVPVERLVDNEGESLWGWWLPHEQEMRFTTGMNPYRLIATILHEALHACIYYREVTLGKEEKLIRLFVSMFVHILMSNPDLTNLIAEEINREARKAIPPSIRRPGGQPRAGRVPTRRVAPDRRRASAAGGGRTRKRLRAGGDR